VSTFDQAAQTAFKSALLAQFPSASDVRLTVSAASIRVDATLVLATEAAAASAAERLRTTPQTTMQEQWFASAGVTLEAAPIVGTIAAEQVVAAGGGTGSLPGASTDAQTAEEASAAAAAHERNIIIGASVGGVVALLLVLACCLGPRLARRSKGVPGEAIAQPVGVQTSVDPSSVDPQTSLMTESARMSTSAIELELSELDESLDDPEAAQAKGWA
jgi:hypothetical protein